MSLYHQKVLEGRKKFLKLTLKKEKEILSIYEEAAKDISERLSKAKAGSLNQRYLTELQKSVKQYTKELRQELSKSIGEGINASSEIAANVQLSYFESMDLEEDLLSTFRKMFTQLPIKVSDTMVNGNYYKDGLTLNQRIWNITKRNGKDIDRIIKVNIAQGRSAGELAKQLDEYINPNKRLNQRTRIPGINKSISYNSARLARTSMTHANTESYIQGLYMNPFCTGLKWNLSSSHYSRQVAKWGEDICDEYAEKVFKPEEYPVAHPNCLCYSTQELEDTDKARDELIRWVKGEDNPKLDKWLNEYGKEFGISGSHTKEINVFSELAATKEENNKIIPMNLQLFKIDEKKELENLISDGVIDRNEYNECYNYFKKCFNEGIDTPLGTVYDKGDRYVHIAYRHQYMISKDQINNIIYSLKEPDTIYKTKDKFGSEGNGYVKKINENELLTIVRDGIITSYYPTKNYINKVKRGEIIWEKR